MVVVLIVLAGFWAGLQNLLAGGGSFVTLPTLIFPVSARLQPTHKSAVALFPCQATAGHAGRRLISGTNALDCLGLVWLVLFATTVFAWGSFRKRSDVTSSHLGRAGTAFAQFCIAFTAAILVEVSAF